MGTPRSVTDSPPVSQVGQVSQGSPVDQPACHVGDCDSSDSGDNGDPLI